MRTRLLVAVLVTLAAGALAAPASSSKPRLHELRSVAQLRALFNRDDGTARLVVIVSPT